MCKNPKEYVCKKNCTWNSAAWTCENDKYLGSIIGYSVFTSDEVLDGAWSETKATRAKPYNKVTKTLSSKTVSTSFDDKKVIF